jgi:hypothetical protein
MVKSELAGIKTHHSNNEPGSTKNPTRVRVISGDKRGTSSSGLAIGMAPESASVAPTSMVSGFKRRKPDEDFTVNPR